MVAVYRAAFLFSCSVSVVMTGAAHRYRNMCRFNSGVRFCLSHPRVDLTNPRSSSIATHYYKISDIIGVSSACFPFRVVIDPSSFDLIQAGRALPL